MVIKGASLDPILAHYYENLNGLQLWVIHLDFMQKYQLSQHQLYSKHKYHQLIQYRMSKIMNFQKLSKLGTLVLNKYSRVQDSPQIKRIFILKVLSPIALLYNLLKLKRQY